MGYPSLSINPSGQLLIAHQSITKKIRSTGWRQDSSYCIRDFWFPVPLVHACHLNLSSVHNWRQLRYCLASLRDWFGLELNWIVTNVKYSSALVGVEVAALESGSFIVHLLISYADAAASTTSLIIYGIWSGTPTKGLRVMIEVCVWRETDRSASAQHVFTTCVWIHRWREAERTGNGKFKDLLRINKIPALPECEECARELLNSISNNDYYKLRRWWGGEGEGGGQMMNMPPSLLNAARNPELHSCWYSDPVTCVCPSLS